MPDSSFVITRRAALAAGGALLFGGLAHAATAQDSTPVATPSGAADAVKLLNAAVEAMTKLDTFAFELTTTQGETVVLEGFTLEGIHGVVRRPADFQTTVTVEIPFASLDLKAVSIGNEVWLELPQLGDAVGGWTRIGASDGVLSLINPDVLILQAVRFIDDAEVAGSDSVGGDDVTVVSGMVDFHGIASRLDGDQQEFASQIAEGPVTVNVAIDGEMLVRRIELEGPILATESSDVVREVIFSDFNKPVEIEQPQI